MKKKKCSTRNRNREQIQSDVCFARRWTFTGTVCISWISFLMSMGLFIFKKKNNNAIYLLRYLQQHAHKSTCREIAVLIFQRSG
ncbi:hypothetical protein FKM82_007692 [Ascaphus truei]